MTMHRRVALLWLSLAPLVTGCAFNQPTGSMYSPAALSSPDKALIYFYRTAGESFGYDRTYFLTVNGQPVVDLLHGGYFPFESSPGPLALVSDVNRSIRTNIAGGFIELAVSPEAARLDLSVDAGKTYFVRLRPEAHAVSFTPHLTAVASDVAERELENCRLLSRRE